MLNSKEFSIIQYRGNFITENSKNFLQNMVVTSVRLDVLLFRSILASEPDLEFDISSTFKILKVINCGPVSLTRESAIAIIHIE